MPVPLIQQLRVGAYIMKQRIQRRERYPLVLMLEPLFRCNLACPGCGKIAVTVLWTVILSAGRTKCSSLLGR